ncbi:hypothetical protein BDZ97DRAFT_137325 [Flammula alnicola]|nr:hypothetical protein BDZ97DRAFT_137325 [Flammula alnicola]
MGCQCNRRIASNRKSREDHFDPTTCARSEGKPCDACMKIAAIDAQIAYAQTLLDGLERERQRLLISEANDRHDPFIQHFPPEITSQIFTFAIQDNPQSTTDQSYRTTPLRLGSICKTWREIAFATPGLWTSINLCLQQEDQISANQVELVTQFLRRSGQVPLSVNLKLLHTPEYPETVSNLNALFSVIKAHAPRWRHLDLFLPNRYFPAFTGDLRQAPLLEYLQLIPRDTGDETELKLGEQFELWEILCLKELKISQFDINNFHGQQMNNLTSFEAEFIAIDEICEVLSRAPRLIHCSLWKILHDESFFELPTAPIRHPSLQSLHISATDISSAPNLATLIDLLELPFLQSFVYTSQLGSEPLRANTLLSFFARSRCSITHISLDINQAGTPSISDDDIVQIFDKLPTITHVSLCCSHNMRIVTDTLLQRFAANYSTANDKFLPRLEVLEYKGPKDFTWRGLGGVFQPGRVQDGVNDHKPRLRRLDISMTGYLDIGSEAIDEDNIRLFSGLKNSGIYLHIESMLLGLDWIQVSASLNSASPSVSEDSPSAEEIVDFNM